LYVNKNFYHILAVVFRQMIKIIFIIFDCFLFCIWKFFWLILSAYFLLILNVRITYLFLNINIFIIFDLFFLQLNSLILRKLAAYSHLKRLSLFMLTWIIFRVNFLGDGSSRTLLLQTSILIHLFSFQLLFIYIFSIF